MQRSALLILLHIAFILTFTSPAHAREILTVTSEPAGARVEINGKAVGTTPYKEEIKEVFFKGPKYFWSEFLSVPLQLTVSKEGYVPQTILMTGGPYRWNTPDLSIVKIFYVITQHTFHINLQPVGGGSGSALLGDTRTAITVSSEPTGAEIYVDGQFDSSTPSKLLLIPGEHTIRVTRPGFKPWERRIIVEPGAEKSLNALLESGTGAAMPVSGAGQAASQQRPELVVVTGPAGSVSAIAFSPDGKNLASGDKEGAIKLWDVRSGAGLRTVVEEGSLNPETPEIAALAFSQNGKMLASATVYDPDILPEPNALPKTVIKLWDVASGRLLSTFPAVNSKIISLAFSPDGRWLASGGMSKTVTLWDVETGSEFKRFTGHVEVVNALMFTQDGTEVLSGSWGSSLDLWYAASGTLLREVKGNPILGPVPGLPELFSVGTVFNQATNRFASMTFSPTAGSSGAAITLRDGTNAQVIKQFRMDGQAVTSLAFSLSGQLLAGGTLDGNIKLWDVNAGTELPTIKRGQSSDVIAMSPDNRIIAQTSGDGKSIKLWDTNDETTMKILEGHTAEINSLAFSPNGKWLASGSDDKTIRLWEVESGRFKTLTGHTEGIGAVAFHPSGKVLASITDNIGISEEDDAQDKTVKLWDSDSGRELKSATFSASAPTAIAFSPDGTVLAVGNHDATISLVEMTSGNVLRTISGNNGEIGSILFTNGETLQSISMDEDETAVEINLWHVSGRILKKNRVEMANASNLSSKETMFLGGMPFMGVSQNFYAMPLQSSGLSLFAKSSDAFDPTSQKETASLYLFGDNDWLVTTPEGFFDGSPGAWRHVLWRFNNNTFDHTAVELYFNEFFYPNLLQDVIAGKSPRPPAGRELEKIDRRQPKVEIVTINGQRKSAPNEQVSTRLMTDKRLASMVIEVTDNIQQPTQPNHAASSGMQDLRLFRNGSLVRLWPGDLFKLGARDGCEQLARARPDEPRRVRCRAEVPIVAGENQLSVYAFNGEKVKSEDDQWTIKGADTLRRGRALYVLAIGVGQYENPQFNLSYAVTDAQAFGAQVRQQQAQVGYYQRVEVIPLMDQAAKKAAILAALKRLAETVQPEDGVVVFFSGHGTAQGDRFYLIPSDLGFQGSRQDVDAASLQTILSHSISDLELEAAVRSLDVGRLFLVIDACNSGKALQADDWRRGPMNTKGLGQLAYEKGMYVLTASQDVELAYESAALKHSYLTYALVEEGLKLKVREADANGDGQLFLREWLGYTTKRVPRLRTERIGQPASQQNKAVEEVEVQVRQEQGKVQQPRVFYRREPELQPFIIAKTGVLR